MTTEAAHMGAAEYAAARANRLGAENVYFVRYGYTTESPREHLADQLRRLLPERLEIRAQNEDWMTGEAGTSDLVFEIVWTHEERRVGLPLETLTVHWDEGLTLEQLDLYNQLLADGANSRIARGAAEMLAES